MTSVIEVEVAPDLKNCKVWISVLGGEEEQKNTMQGLKSACGFIRRELAHQVNLRNTPELHFLQDDSIAYGVEMAHRIDEVKAQDAAAEESRRSRGIDINDTSAYVDDAADDDTDDDMDEEFNDASDDASADAPDDASGEDGSEDRNDSMDEDEAE